MTIYQQVPKIIQTKSGSITYERGKFLGKGAFGRCYEITAYPEGIKYCGKIVPKSKFFKDEVTILRQMKHPNIVQLHKVLKDSKFVCMVFDLCKLQSLEKLRSKNGQKFELPEIRYIMEGILNGLKYLHQSMNIIHRDFKLDNIFLNEDFEVKIGDFGLATKLNFVQRFKKVACGTPNYQAPEIIQNKKYTYAVDIWSLGCILYTLLTGKLAFEGKSVRQIHGKILALDYDEAKIPCPIAKNLVKSILQKDPKDRPSLKTIQNDIFMKLSKKRPVLHYEDLEKPFTKSEKLTKEINNNNQPLLPSRLAIVDVVARKFRVQTSTIIKLDTNVGKQHLTYEQCEKNGY